MATRRPKVPRADALGRQPQDKQPQDRQTQDKADGGQVIRADFGGTRQGPAATSPAAASHATAASDGGKAAKAPKAGTARNPAGKGSAAKSSASKSSAAKAPHAKAASAAAGKTGVGGSDETPQHDPVPAKAFSGRMLALAVVMIAITIMLAPTVKIFLEKRAEISALEAEIESKKSEQAELNKQLSRWQDPNYVKQQARDRINMVMPGETGYWVFGGDVPAGTPGGRTGSGASGSPANLPWVDALWESIRRSATD
ncbi:septum formation initiator family protein [Arthrobacter sp. CJ23]|uniref:FtsB family cell division protein n=1 Tax=Arthrobacter sp. CJ23 TaxID=2972479 RepID=UPI00215C1900|nr:septum formation initiator family protein [Arthrobacter sp. CJ23]UVJ40658.1 septum formation initiator family protein [Arthrobacter sp. CJ23]